VLIAWLGWLGVSLCTVIRRAISGPKPDAPRGTEPFVFLAVFSLAGAAITAAVLCLSRATDSLAGLPWEEYSRYLLGPQAVGWFGWAAWAAHFTAPTYRPRVRFAAAAVPVALGIVPLMVAVVRCGPPVRDVFDYYPADVRALDDACRARGLTCGLADYGLAKRAMVLTRTGVIVRQVTPDHSEGRAFAGFHWLSNAQWYWRPAAGQPGPVRYQFVVAHENPGHPWLLNAGRVAEVFGEPAARVPLDGPILMVYDRPEDAAFREFADRDPGLLGLRERYDPPGK
jgi:hypothetical protein